MAENNFKRKSNFKYSIICAIHSIVVLVIMIGFKYIVPAVEPLTPLGVEILGIFLGMMYGWLIVGNLVWPSVVGLVLFGLSDYTTVTKAFSAGFGNSTVLLLLFFFLFTNIINSAGIIEFIAHWIVTRKFAYGRPWVLSLLLMLAAIISFFMVTATAACLVMMPLIKSIATLYGFKPGDKWPMLMLFGLVYVGSTSYLILPYKSMPLVALGSYEAITGESIVYGPYLLMVLAATLLSLLVFLIFCRFVFRPDVSPIVNCQIALDNKIHFSSYQKFVMGFFVAVLALMIFPNILPKSIFIVDLLRQIGNTGILALSIVFYLALNFEEGIKIEELFAKNISWGIIFLLAAALTISNAFTSEETGISSWLFTIVNPIIQGKSILGFVIIVGVLACIFTNLSHNLVACTVFIPIIISIGNAFDVSIATLVIYTMAICNVGMITPAASSVGAFLHNDKEWVPGKSAYLYGFICSLFNLIIGIFAIYFLGSLLML